MATGDGVLVVGTSRFRSQRGQLIAYPFPCGDAGVACMPLWRANLDGAGSPVVANGVVYATGRRRSDLVRVRDRLWLERPGVLAAVDGGRGRHGLDHTADRRSAGLDEPRLRRDGAMRCSGSMWAAPTEAGHARRRGTRR